MLFLSAAALAVVLSMYCQSFVPEAGQFPLDSIHMLCQLHWRKRVMQRASCQPNYIACLTEFNVMSVFGQQLLVLIL